MENTKGEPLKVNCAGPFGFHEGLAGLCRDDKCGFVDKKGEIIIPFEYDDALCFENGFAAVKKGGKWGFIDKNNNIVIPFNYLDIRL